MLKKCRAYLCAHRRVRIALIVVLVLLALLLILHPREQRPTSSWAWTITAPWTSWAAATS